MTRLLRTLLFSSILALPIASIAAPDIWDPDFGADTGLVSDDSSMAMTLGFMFPFDGVMYDTVGIGTNGGIMLGNGGVFAFDMYTRYWTWQSASFEGNFTNYGNPGIFAFVTDLDNGSGVGTIHFKTDSTTAVITWDGIASYWNDVIPFITFQVTLESDGTIIFGYDGIVADLVIDQNNGIVVGVSNGLGAAIPDSSDLSAAMNIDVTSPTAYEIWCQDENFMVGGNCFETIDGSRPDNYAFDLDQTNVIFTPNGTGGYDLATAIAPVVVDSGIILGEYGGCTVGVADGTLDPTLPLLVLISLFYLLMRRRAEV